MWKNICINILLQTQQLNIVKPRSYSEYMERNFDKQIKSGGSPEVILLLIYCNIIWFRPNL